jgi:hypothetical protein
MQTKVSIGITSIIGWLTAIAGAIPIIVKLLEEGQAGVKLEGPEKWAAIFAVVSLAITQLGRYLQAHALILNPAATPAVNPPVNPPMVPPANPALNPPAAGPAS